MNDSTLRLHHQLYELMATLRANGNRIKQLLNVLSLNTVRTLYQISPFALSVGSKHEVLVTEVEGLVTSPTPTPKVLPC